MGNFFSSGGSRDTFTNLTDLFGPTLETGSSSSSTAALLPSDGVVAIYFSAHWCPPCRSFTPVLAETYITYQEDCSDEDTPFRIVFVSSDKTLSEFSSYFNSMPFLALPYSASGIKRKLSNIFSIRGIPSLVVLDAKTGKILSSNGRNDIVSAKGGDIRGVLQKWIANR